VRPAVLLPLGALAALVIHVLVLGDLWDPTVAEWVTWLGLEAVLAVLVGVLAGSSRLVVATVLGGWFLQAVYFAVGTPKDEDHNLWAVGLVELAFLGVLALGAALLAQLLAGRVRRRAGG
jgi:hypothetical protein